MISEQLRSRLAAHTHRIASLSGLYPTAAGTVGRARVVGLGAAVRHAARPAAAMRALTLGLVVHGGFRAVSIEGTGPPFDIAAALDRHLTDGDGDPREILRAGQGFLHTEEILALVADLRSATARHPDDPVRIVHGHRDHESAPDLAGIERSLADRLLGWHAATGHRIVHWGGAAHVLAGDPRGIAAGGAPDPSLAHRNAGGRLRAHLGDDYAAVAVTVGAVEGGGGHRAVPGVPPSFTEAALDSGSSLAWCSTRDAPAALDDWLDAPLRTRCIGPVYDPDRDRDHFVTAPRVRDAVDAFLHVQRSAAATPL